MSIVAEGVPPASVDAPTDLLTANDLTDKKAKPASEIDLKRKPPPGPPEGSTQNYLRKSLTARLLSPRADTKH